MVVYPNPSEGNVEITYHLSESQNIKLKITNGKGQILEDSILKNQKLGVNTFDLERKDLGSSGFIFITIETPSQSMTQKIILN